MAATELLIKLEIVSSNLQTTSLKEEVKLTLTHMVVKALQTINGISVFDSSVGKTVHDIPRSS